MVINSDIKVAYRGDGQTTVFPFSFPFFDKNYICVRILDEETGISTTLESDYYVDAANSTVHYPGYAPGQEPPEAERPGILSATCTLTIYRNTEISQLIELGEKFPLPVIEKALDKITEILQEHKEEISRSVKVDITSTVTPDQLIEEIRNSTATAIEAKITAVASAAAAEASKTNAANSASSASASQQAAAASETNAAASAAAAAQSATDLETAVTTATTKAAEALASQQAAAASETNAANSASAAATSQQAAATSATAAATSATNASNSASAAAGSATSAAGSATEAAETAASIDHHAGYRQPSTNYSEGNMANNSGLPYGWYLECTTPGITSASDLTITSPSVGDTVTDGTVTWTIREIGAADLSSCANTDLSNLSASGEEKLNAVAGFNHRKVITTSGTWTAPTSGHYKVTCIGGGGAGGSNGYRGGKGGGTTSFGSYLSAIGGGGGGGGNRSTTVGGSGGGGAGKVTTTYVMLTESTTVTCTIGAGGVISTTDNTAPTGTDAGVNAVSTTNVAYGAKNAGNPSVGMNDSSGRAYSGGNGASNGTGYGGGGGGACGGPYMPMNGPGNGGDNGGDAQRTFTSNASTLQSNGGNGGNGAIIIEYYQPA